MSQFFIFIFQLNISYYQTFVRYLQLYSKSTKKIKQLYNLFTLSNEKQTF